MNRGKLLFLQILVAVVSIGLWHVLTSYPICGLSRLGREKATIAITLLSISLALPTLIWGH